MAKSRSSIEMLPREVLEELHGFLQESGVTVVQVTERVNTMLEDLGEAQRVSKSAVNRYDLRFREATNRMREQRQLADVWVGKFGAAPQGQTGLLINELLRSLVFDLGLKLEGMELDDENMPGVISMANKLSLAVQRLEASATINIKREGEIREQERAKMLEQIEKVGGGQAMTAEQMKAEIMKVYGA